MQWKLTKRQGKYMNCVLQVVLFTLKFVGTVFVSSLSIISQHVITESSIIVAKYFPFWKSHVAGIQIQHSTFSFNLHQHLSLSHH